MKTAVIVFPGSNCDRDARTVLHRICRREPTMIWHEETSLPFGLDLVVVPGGFSYGDYLRSGSMAARTPIMQEVFRFASRGGRVLGICNGFQVLTEIGLLPGTLLRNKGLNFVCKNTHLRVENNDSKFTHLWDKGEVITVPVAHHDGNYFADADTLKRLNDENGVAFRYCTAEGAITDDANPNGSAENIAGIFNDKHNVLGMMPHPERHAEELLGGMDGVALFNAVLHAA